MRFENHLDENPLNRDRNNFGAPNLTFLTHLHNGHTAPESDGNPNYRPQAYLPGEFSDNLYLNWPAGNDDRECQSFFWFHDHKMDHTGADVYKGMVGLFPIYSTNDEGDETKGWRLPGVPNAQTGRIDYDIPLALYDCVMDDGITPHRDFHTNLATGGVVHPEWWGQTFFKHYPDTGFVGDIFTVNGTAFPVLEVKRRKYRLRFLGASISRCYEIKFQTGTLRAAPGTQGQWQLDGAQQCMRMTQIASEGGLLPAPVVRDTCEIWPAKRREFILDFSKYQDGSPTHKGDVLYLTNILDMPNGRKPNFNNNGVNPNFNVPLMRIVIGDDAPDNSLIPPRMRASPPVPNATQLAALPKRTFTLERSGSAGGEIQWQINGFPFNPLAPLAFPAKGSAEVWTIQNGGGGWTHPFHLHMEEHHILSRTGRPRPDDTTREDVVALDPSETVTLYRQFRDFTGPYVAHCHNLAHEDHAMMFGWNIVDGPAH